MMCAWQEFLSILPVQFRGDVDRIGRASLQELRLRINSPPELVLASGQVWLNRLVSKSELEYVVNTASKYSPWCMTTSAQGYFTAPGGHRIGICGEAVVKNGEVCGIRQVNSLCIRIARDFSGIGQNLAGLSGSVIILGAPGWGKTTLLRDVIRHIGKTEHVCVVDERRELFPEGIDAGKCTDILLGCSKRVGIEMLLRTMGPSCIAVDEITAESDTCALVKAHGCGVRLWATAHADSIASYFDREIYKPLIDKNIFRFAVVLHKDKSYTVERMDLCYTSG